MPATLDTIKRLGITNIEFSNLFKKTAAEIRQLLDERGMRCTSFGVSYADLVEKTASAFDQFAADAGVALCVLAGPTRWDRRAPETAEQFSSY